MASPDRNKPESEPPMIQVEVVYARPGHAWSMTVRLPLASTVEDAILASGLKRSVTGFDWQNGVGIHSRRCELGQLLTDGDRVEIYRPLQIDPKERRRQRA